MTLLATVSLPDLLSPDPEKLWREEVDEILLGVVAAGVPMTSIRIVRGYSDYHAADLIAIHAKAVH